MDTAAILLVKKKENRDKEEIGRGFSASFSPVVTLGGSNDLARPKLAVEREVIADGKSKCKISNLKNNVFNLRSNKIYAKLVVVSFHVTLQVQVPSRTDIKSFSNEIELSANFGLFF